MTDTEANEAYSPMPRAEAEFHVEPHPDPIVQALVLEIERLRADIVRLKEELQGAETR
jgi:hypothetical protein